MSQVDSYWNFCFLPLGGEPENRKEKMTGRVGRLLLLRRGGSKDDTLLDVALEAFHTSFEEDLFVFVDAGKWVDGFLCSVCLICSLAYGMISE